MCPPYIAVRQARSLPVHFTTPTTDLSCSSLFLVPEQKELVFSTRFLDWNSALRLGIQHFCHTHPGASAFLFSSYRLFESILDMPEVYGFNSEHAREPCGTVWMDSLHPTSKVHDHIASNLADFLQEIAPSPV